MSVLGKLRGLVGCPGVELSCVQSRNRRAVVASCRVVSLEVAPVARGVGVVSQPSECRRLVLLKEVIPVSDGVLPACRDCRRVLSS